MDEREKEKKLKKRKIESTVAKQNNVYLNKLKQSDRQRWCDKRRTTFKLAKSYMSEKEKDRKWKNLETLKCDKPIKFQLGSLMTNLISAEKSNDSENSYPLWAEMYSNMRELQPHTRGGIGSSDAEFLGISYTDPHALVNKVGEELTSTHLNKLEAVEIVHDSFDNASGKNKMVYFMEDGSIKKLSIEELVDQIY